MPCTPSVDLFSRKLVLVTGKGGVGKTTIAAALGRASAAANKRVLLGEVGSSTDTRSQLFSLLGRPDFQEDVPTQIEPRLYGVRIAPSVGHRLFLRAALKVRMVADTAMKSKALRRFLMAAPSFPEIGTLYHLVELLRADDFDQVILDLPATGHALGLAALPRTVLRVVSSGIIGQAIKEGLDLLTDPVHSAALIVTLPENMPVTEAVELADGLRELHIPISAMLLNRMPENPFEQTELAALRGLLKGDTGTPILGARELRRLERALSARERFRTEGPQKASKIEVPFFDAAASVLSNVQGRLHALSEAVPSR